MELTREDFEVILDHKLDQKLDEKLDQKLANFATKADMEAQTKELKQFAEEQTESLARIIATTVAEPLEDVKTRVIAIEQRAYRAY